MSIYELSIELFKLFIGSFYLAFTVFCCGGIIYEAHRLSIQLDNNPMWEAVKQCLVMSYALSAFSIALLLFVKLAL